MLSCSVGAGGHLFFNLYRAGIFDESQARLYTAEIVAAISHLHDLHIVHRDLKPVSIRNSPILRRTACELICRHTSGADMFMILLTPTVSKRDRCE